MKIAQKWDGQPLANPQWSVGPFAEANIIQVELQVKVNNLPDTARITLKGNHYVSIGSPVEFAYKKIKVRGYVAKLFAPGGGLTVAELTHVEVV